MDKDHVNDKIEELKTNVEDWLGAKKGEMEAEKRQAEFTKRRREIEDSVSDQAEDVKLKIKDALDQLQNRAETLWNKLTS